MILSIISAIGKNNEIGRKNELLWNLPADMKHFKETTQGHTVVMGQKTFESIGRPLPNRRNIIITLDKNYKNNDIEIVHSKEELKALLNKTTKDNEEVFIIGGGQIYRLFMDIVDKLYITHVDASFPDADTFFPDIVPIVFLETSREEHRKDEKNAYNYAFVTYNRF